MATNAGKRLDRLEKLLDKIGAQDQRHHYLLLSPNDNEIEKTQAIGANDGDTIQSISIPWIWHDLQSPGYIPEGNPDDPLGDPRERQGNVDREGDGGTVFRSVDTDGLIGASASSLALDQGRVERWRRHEQQVEMDGDRYQGASPALTKPVTY